MQSFSSELNESLIHVSFLKKNEALKQRDLEQLETARAKFHGKVLACIQEYRHWLNDNNTSNSDLGHHYSVAEGNLLKQQITDCYDLYRSVTNDYYTAKRQYLYSFVRPYTLSEGEKAA